MTDQQIKDAAYAELIARVEEMGRRYAEKYPPKKPTKFYDAPWLGNLRGLRFQPSKLRV